jgi:hypothetical protein
MIVKVGAWLFIVNGVLGVLSSNTGPFGMGGPDAASVLLSALFLAVGIGLLHQKVWARWLALGVSFLTWTIGSLLLLFIVVWALSEGKLGAFLAASFMGGVGGAVVRWVLFYLLVMLVTVIIDYKLFFHLCSEEGCEEFGVTHGSIGTVALSVVAWLVIMFFDASLSRGDAVTRALASMSAESRRREASNHAQMERDRAQLREYEESRARAERAAQLQNRQEDDRVRRQEEMNRIRAEESARREAEQRARIEPQSTGTSQEDEKPSSRILKCRDASGGITFTQGYCPPGTKLVEMPASE